MVCCFQKFQTNRMLFPKMQYFKHFCYLGDGRVESAVTFTRQIGFTVVKAHGKKKCLCICICGGNNTCLWYIEQFNCEMFSVVFYVFVRASLPTSLLIQQ